MQFILRAFDRLRHRARKRSWDPGLALGRRGEDIAHRHLRRSGYTILARNFRTRTGSGEIDIIAQDGLITVFVEVKSRATEEYGPPDRAVTTEKQAGILRAANEYLRRRGIDWGLARFDVINVVTGHPVSIRHVEDAFSLLRKY